MVQPDMKKLVAYSSVSHLGFVVLGICAMNVQGMQGAVYQMLAHGVSTGGLFLMVGMLSDRRHTRLISEFGGLKAVMPRLTAAFFIMTLASIGLPGLNGFVGEFLIMLGAFRWDPRFVVGAGLGVILSAVYMLWMFQRVYYGEVTHEENAHAARSAAARVGERRAALRGGDRHGRLPDAVPQADGTGGREARAAAAERADAACRTATGQNAKSKVKQFGHAVRRQARGDAVPCLTCSLNCLDDMFNSAFDAIVPMLCVTLAALASMGAEAFRGRGERMPIGGLGIVGLVGAGGVVRAALEPQHLQLRGDRRRQLRPVRHDDPRHRRRS